jgi:hypothetical protein
MRSNGVLLVIVLLLACVPGTSEARVPKDFFGIDAGQIIGGGSLDVEFGGIASGGVQVVRTQAFTEMPPTPWNAEFYWHGQDMVELSAAAAGLRWYPFIGYAPLTFRGGAGPRPTAPKRAPDYAAYAASLARRYGPDGSFWQEHPELPQLPVTTYEIWNEENSTAYWRPGHTAPERYAELYLAARAAIKRVQPGARVIVGGLAVGGSRSTMDEVLFLRRMFAHRPSLRRNLDAVGFHPYQRTVPEVYARIARLRRALDHLVGPQVPIEITEVGWSRKFFSEGTRGADLRRLAIELPRSDCNITRLIPFNWVDSFDTDGGFGISDWDARIRPSGRAYFHAVKRMRGLSGRQAPNGRVRICHSG